jgi:protein phosphatase
MDYRHEHGPFDIIGDIHGCYEELCELLTCLGYEMDLSNVDYPSARHPQKRMVIFLGDLVDRGPQTPAVLRLVMGMVNDGTAACVAGNHDVKLMKKLKGQDVRITHGLKESLAQLERESSEFKAEVANFIEGLIGHLLLDDGKLVVAHAGMKKELQGLSSNEARQFALYGETTGETDECGLPVRYNWAKDYSGEAIVVYGHTPVLEPEWVNKTICVDTGCVFGGRLTALRYPENELVSVKALRTYYQPVKFR